MTPARRRALLAAAAGIYAGMFLLFDGLRFPVRKDEDHFWPTSQAFAREGWPSADFLRDTPELNTPLPFMAFGAVERLTGWGIFGGRLLNFLLSFSLLAFLAAGPGARWPAAPWAAAGFLLCPYAAFVSVHLYTDVIAVVLAVGGLALHRRGNFWAAAALFALGIAARQYDAAFPLALAAEAAWRSAAHRFRPVSAWLAPALAAATLAGWYAFFGGPAPARELVLQSIPPGRWHPDHALYFLSCLGFYFVLPEAFFFRRLPWRGTGRAAMVTAVLAAAAFLLWPPLGNEGYALTGLGFLDQAARKALSGGSRAALYASLAALVLLRLRPLGRGWWLTAANGALLVKSHIAWDKYVLPLLAALWYLLSRERPGEAPEV